MSIYEEALVDAKKLKEVAENEAKNAILEAIAPRIKQMISREAAGLSSPLFEQEEEQLPQDPALAGLPVSSVGDPGLPATAAAMSAPAGMETPVAPPPAVSGMDDAPITAGGADAMNMPLPGPDGKLVVDFEDLFTATDEPGEIEADETSASAETSPVAGHDGELDASVAEVPPSSAGEMAPPDAALAPPMPGAEGLPAPEELPTTATDEDLSFEAFRENLDRLSRRIDIAYKKASIPAIVREALQENLFESIEKLEKLSAHGKISSRLTALTESRLEFLHMKLKEAIVGTNYRSIEKGDDDMSKKSLRNLASKLFEEAETLKMGDITSPADSFEEKGTLKVDNSGTEAAADKAGAHAKKITVPTVTLKTEAALYEEELHKLEEELKEVLAAEEGEQDLAGAASTIPDEKVGKVDTTKSTAGSPSNPASKVQGVKNEAVEADDDDDELDEFIEHDKASGSEKEVDEVLEVADEELAEAVRSIKKENIKRRMRALKEELAECDMESTMPVRGMEDEAMMGGVPGGGMSPSMPGMKDEQTVVNFNFDLDDLGVGAGDEMGGEDDDMMGAADMGAGEDDMGGLDDLEVVDDGDEDLSAGGPPSSFGGDEEGSEGEDDELETEASGLPAPGLDNMGVMGLAEGRRRKLAAGKKPVVTEAKQVRALRAQLAESQLWNAKVLFLNKFLYKEELSRTQKQKIAEYLDKATTLAEAKTIYGRVKSLLESAAAKKKVGSSGRTSVGRGADSVRQSLEESKKTGENKDNLFEGASLEATSRNRLQELAGIKKSR